MNPAGALLIIAGLWAVVQLVKGDALARLGLTDGGGGARPSTLQRTPGMAGGAASAQGSAAVQAVLRQALSAQGTPYASAATDTSSDRPAAFTCSTFTAWVFKKALGVDMIPLTYTQVGYGTSVPVGPQFVQPGDLIFSADSEGHQFGHVGIALDATTKVHAPRTGDVVRTTPIDWGSVQAVRRVVTS